MPRSTTTVIPNPWYPHLSFLPCGKPFMTTSLPLTLPPRYSCYSCSGSCIWASPQPGFSIMFVHSACWRCGHQGDTECKSTERPAFSLPSFVPLGQLLVILQPPLLRSMGLEWVPWHSSVGCPQGLPTPRTSPVVNKAEILTFPE